MAGDAMNETRARRRHPIRVLPLILWAALPLSACSGPVAPARAPLEGARIGGPFTLIDQNGRTVTDRDFAGKYRIMYFG